MQLNASFDWQQVVDFSDYARLLPLVHNSLIAGVLIGVVGGLVSVFVTMRDLPFAVHGVSELSFAGAAGGLLLGTGVVAGAFAGSLLAALAFGLLGTRARDRNSITGVLVPFGLGLGILFITLYEGRTANKFGLLTGQIVAVDDTSLGVLAVTCTLVLITLLVIWRPLTFASTDPLVASARGVPVAFLGTVFMVLLGATVAVSVQIIGALLILAVLSTPAAAAVHLTKAPVGVALLSVLFATVSMLGGILLAVGTAVPISPYVTTLSFAIYLVCRAWGRRRSPSAGRPRFVGRSARSLRRATSES